MGSYRFCDSGGSVRCAELGVRVNSGQHGHSCRGFDFDSFLLDLASCLMSLVLLPQPLIQSPFTPWRPIGKGGAKEALFLLRNASRVSSVCNDVVGDICGIVSGATGAVIVVQLQQVLHLQSVLVSVVVTALISGLTIGGKALSKTFAMRQSTRVVYWAGRFYTCFTAEEAALT